MKLEIIYTIKIVVEDKDVEVAVLSYLEVALKNSWVSPHFN